MSDTAAGAEPAEEVEEPAEASPPRRLLRGPDLLTASEASRIAAEGNSRLVVWAGERNSGKTTLSAEIYERHRSRLSATTFSGSQTLLGFEERIHPARAESGRLIPHTTRTEADPEGRELLHLALVANGETTHLLFADIPGELFRQVRDHELAPQSLPLLGRADKLAVLVDGAELANPGQRPAAISFARQMIGALAGAELPGEQMDIRLVVTKLDLLTAAGEAATGYWDQRENDLLEDLRRISPRATVLRTAARGTGVPDDGMDSLLDWLVDPPPDPTETLAESSTIRPTRIQRLREPKAAR
jgi:hypothetical protein